MHGITTSTSSSPSSTFSSLSSLPTLTYPTKLMLRYHTTKPIYLPPKSFNHNSFIGTTSHLRNINNVRVQFNKYTVTPLPLASTTPLRGDQQPANDYHNADDYDYEMNRIEKDVLPEIYSLGNNDYNRIPIIKFPLYQTGGLFYVFILNMMPFTP